MSKQETRIVKTDVLVVGAGIAGIRAAIEAHDRRSGVLLASKGSFGQDGASTWMAGSGYAVALYPPDNPDTHFNDTIVGGSYLNNQKLLSALISLVPQTARELAQWGVRFKKDTTGRFAQWALPGHTCKRSLCLKHPGMSAGPELKQALVRQVRRRTGIRVVNDLIFTGLLLKNDVVVGAVALDIVAGEFVVFNAKSVILATGGVMQCYKLTTAGSSCTGEGHALAYRSGVRMTDMEFMQFLPPVAIWPPSVAGDRTPYSLQVNLRGTFLNNQGERFMERYYPLEKDWATRDAISRAIASEIRAGRGSPHGGVYLALNHVPVDLLDAYLNNNKTSRFLVNIQKAGIDLHRDTIEVAPGAHFTQGGCQINQRCETNKEGLYAVGEVSGGVHGVDRLAGNALPLCMAMGIIGGREASSRARDVGYLPAEAEQVENFMSKGFAPLARERGLRPSEIKNKVRCVLDKYGAFNRTHKGLSNAIKALADIREIDLLNLATAARNRRYNTEWVEALEAEGMVDVAEMICRAALARTESRGCHERADYPETRPEWLKNTVIEENSRGEMLVSTAPVELPFTRPQNQGIISE